MTNPMFALPNYYLFYRKYLANTIIEMTQHLAFYVAGCTGGGVRVRYASRSVEDCVIMHSS